MDVKYKKQVFNNFYIMKNSTKKYTLILEKIGVVPKFIWGEASPNPWLEKVLGMLM